MNTTVREYRLEVHTHKSGSEVQSKFTSDEGGFFIFVYFFLIFFLGGWEGGFCRNDALHILQIQKVFYRNFLKEEIDVYV